MTGPRVPPAPAAPLRHDEHVTVDHWILQLRGLILGEVMRVWRLYGPAGE